jgi:hypothetical protein
VARCDIDVCSSTIPAFRDMVKTRASRRAKESALELNRSVDCFAYPTPEGHKPSDTWHFSRTYSKRVPRQVACAKESLVSYEMYLSIEGLQLPFSLWYVHSDHRKSP